MKRLGLLLICVATLAMVSCGLANSVSSSNAVAQASGQTCGTAVQGLYKAYKATGTINLSDATNFNNALTVASAYSNLRQNKDNQSYRKAFTTGLIASSAGLITTENASSFVDQLLAASGLANVNSQNIAQTATTAMAIITLLNALK